MPSLVYGVMDVPADKTGRPMKNVLWTNYTALKSPCCYTVLIVWHKMIYYVGMETLKIL